jgi:septin 7
MKEINQHKIKIYDFPESTGEEGEGADATRALRSRVPYAVVGANSVIELEGRRVRGRKYPWGVAEGNLLYIPTYIHTSQSLSLKG